MNKPTNGTARNIMLMAVLCAGLILISTQLARGFPGNEGQTIAAWFQAVGSIGAILCAFLIADRQSKQSLNAIVRAQKLTQDAKKGGVLAVAEAAHAHALRIGEAMSLSDPIGELYRIYDPSIIKGVVGALSTAPIYELGSAQAVSSLLSLTDQFVLLGKQVDRYLAGPWKDPNISAHLETYSSPENLKVRSEMVEGATKQYAINVRQKVEFINTVYADLEAALTSS